jgi:hypothetical protein
MQFKTNLRIVGATRRGIMAGRINPVMKTEGFKHRFVAWGGWVNQTRLTKPKTAFVWTLAAAWFGGFGALFSSLTEIGAILWSVACVGQVGLVVAAIVMSILETAVTKTRRVRNPEKKTECLY